MQHNSQSGWTTQTSHSKKYGFPSLCEDRRHKWMSTNKLLKPKYVLKRCEITAAVWITYSGFLLKFAGWPHIISGNLRVKNRNELFSRAASRLLKWPVHLAANSLSVLAPHWGLNEGQSPDWLQHWALKISEHGALQIPTHTQTHQRDDRSIQKTYKQRRTGERRRMAANKSAVFKMNGNRQTCCRQTSQLL